MANIKVPTDVFLDMCKLIVTLPQEAVSELDQWQYETYMRLQDFVELKLDKFEKRTKYSEFLARQRGKA